MKTGIGVLVFLMALACGGTSGGGGGDRAISDLGRDRAAQDDVVRDVPAPATDRPAGVDAPTLLDTPGASDAPGAPDLPPSTGAIPGGGTVFLAEPFDDPSFAARGWYDSSGGTISTTEHIPGSAGSFECAFEVGASGCSGGTPTRFKITPSETVYLSFWIKLSDNWVGSGRPYHPHMFHFINDLENDFVGPAFTALTTYTEIVEGRAQLALQDGKNVDPACVLRNDDTFVGCNGDFATYPFTENRSVCACNGLAGDLDGRDCFPTGNDWYSSRSWAADGAFVDAPGPSYKGDWHFVEAYFAMNSIQNGIGVPDGKIRWVQDGQTLISHDRILLRTGANPTLRFAQFAMLPYIGDGSPVAQSFWIDDLTLASARP